MFQRICILLIFLCPLAAVAAQDVTIKGKDFYLDGKPWLPKGIQIEGLNRPFGTYESVVSQASARQGRSWWGVAELNEIKRVFGADVIRFQVSQPGLDPQSPIYSPAYVSELHDAFKLARSHGFVVIVSMDAQGENGIPNLSGMPNESTFRAWQTLAPPLLHDPGVMLELFNEPSRANWGEAQKEWAGEMQMLIDGVRKMGATNILLLDGLGYAQSTNDLFTLVHDSMHDRMALAVHPYFNGMKAEIGKASFNPQDYFYKHFGASAAHPIIATEWNATPTNGCVGKTTPTLALELMRYLESLHIGLVGWAIDSNYGKLIKDHTSFEPTDYSTFTDCSKTPGIAGGGKLLANFPND
jgi:endoglucanase